MDELHFLRPWWLAGIVPTWAALWMLWRRMSDRTRWREVCDPHLLEHLLVARKPTARRLALALLGAASFIALLALAGPSVGTGTPASAEHLNARVVVFDLSPSMNAIDVAPSRLERARAEVAHILAATRADQLGLVVFAADAFVVAPMTRDVETLAHLLAALRPELMPRAGSRPDLGLATAAELLRQSGVTSGDIIYVGDSAGDERAVNATAALASAGFRTSVLAVGSVNGGPIRAPSGHLATHENGEVVISGIDVSAMRALAEAGGGVFDQLGVINSTSPPTVSTPIAWLSSPDSGGQHMTRQSRDDGPWLVLLLLPIAALAFRRGWLMVWVVLLVPLKPLPAEAFDWRDLWSRADQQAWAALYHGADHQGLTEADQLPALWRGIVLHHLGHYAKAADAFAQHDSALAHYNRGNALVAKGDLGAALAAYEYALRLQPDEPDALHNHAVVTAGLRSQRGLDRVGGAMRPSSQIGESSQHRAREQRRPNATGGNERASTVNRQSSTDRQSGPGSGEGHNGAGATGKKPRAGSNANSTPLLTRSQLQQLTRQLAALNEDAGELLRQRFAIELRNRGDRDNDTGARW